MKKAEQLSEYELYEKKCKEIQKENEEYLKIFYDDLTKAHLSKKTIRQHMNNVDFYINDFLLHYEAYNIKEGAYKLNEFLGDFFIRKCMWSTPQSIKTTAASIKKFYKSMLDHKKINEEDYEFLVSDIKYELDCWQDTCAQYNDPDDFDSPFFL